MFRGPRDYSKLDLKEFGGHKDEVSICFNIFFYIILFFVINILKA